ncbi:LysE family translocator [Roseomonas nepalensis]|uniref:LysE family translocator n=1 Tax=Muricoccus nepalensis TaxID=1854500 RepID=A0A502FG58_9PROT|nr:LysE family translocator [Roseomonas nepalensis]TPG48430.1 LysE family translocator [Roseomonas nepalensis]
MTLSGLLVFAAAYLVATASPGPGIAALVARVLAKGTRGVPWFIAGFVVGDLAWLAITAAGLSVLAQRFAVLFLVIKYAGAAYLLFLAFRLWSAPRDPVALDRPVPAESGPRLFLAGLAVTLGNPKVIVFFVALLPTVVRLDALSLAGLLEIAALGAAILTAVLSGYALAAARARRLFTSPRAVRALNRGTGAVMAGAAVAIAAR